MGTTKELHQSPRNLVAFWIFGLCINFAFVVMLSGAQDILNKEKIPEETTNATMSDQGCLPSIPTRYCTQLSAGLVLISNIVPSVISKVAAPFVIHHIPYGMRHMLIFVSQTASLLLVGLSTDVLPALIGVSLASFSSGFGEITFLALASHYSPNTISTWSSGTGASGIVASLVYAGLTDRNILGVAPEKTMLYMLVVPILFTITYNFLLVPADSMQQCSLTRPSTWVVQKRRVADVERLPETLSDDGSDDLKKPSEWSNKWIAIQGLFKYMLPLFVMYFAQYFINQGVVELIVFDCSSGLRQSPQAQYRWYQVLYQIGVFISRSSVNLVRLPFSCIVFSPVVQVSFAALLLLHAISPFVPHILFIYTVVFCEGLVAGSTYVNSMHHIHKKVSSEHREFSLLFVTIANALGIVVAAVVSMPVHNTICNLPLYHYFF